MSKLLLVFTKPWPPRPAEIGTQWSNPWRQAWADRAEYLQQQGDDWRDAERTAYVEMCELMDAGQPPPAHDPSIHAALNALTSKPKCPNPNQPASCRQEQASTDPRTDRHPKLIAWLDKTVGFPTELYWGGEPFMSGAKRRDSYQIMPHMGYTMSDGPQYDFWAWYFDTQPQWYATPSEACEAFAQGYRRWTLEHNAPVGLE